MKLRELITELRYIPTKLAFYYCRALGTAPVNFTIKPYNSHIKRWIFTYNWINIAYNLILCFVSIYGNYWIIGNILSDVTNWDNIIKTISNNSIVLCNACTIIYFCVKRKRGIDLLNRLNKAREIVYKNHDFYPKKLRNELTFLLISALCLQMFYQLARYYLTINSPRSSYVFELQFLIPGSIVVQYAILLNVVKFLYKNTNEMLSKALNDLPDQIAFERKLMEFSDSYSLLTQIVGDLSDFYSFPILSCIYTASLQITKTIYLVAMSSFTQELFLNNANLLYNSVRNYYGLLILTSLVTAVMNQDERTRMLINGYLKIDNLHQRIYDKLTQYSIYFLHNKIEISIFNVCCLDNSFVLKIIGAMTTYLVILVQFRPDDTIDRAFTDFLPNTTIV